MQTASPPVFPITRLCWLAHCCVQWCAGGENINAGRPDEQMIKAVVAGLSLNTLEALAPERRTKLNSLLDDLFCPTASFMH